MLIFKECMGCFLNCKSEVYKKVFQIPNFVIQKLLPEKNDIFNHNSIDKQFQLFNMFRDFFLLYVKIFLLYGHCCIVVSKVKVDLVIDFSFNDQRCFYYWPRRDYKSWSISFECKGQSTSLQHSSTLKPRYNEPWYSEFCNIVNKIQLPFWGFTKHITFDIVNYI